MEILQTMFTNYQLLHYEVKLFSKGESIYRSEDRINALYIIEKGEIRLDNYQSDGSYFVLVSNSSPKLLGDIEYITNSKALYNVVAHTDIECIKIPLKENRVFIDNDLLFYKNLCHSLANKFEKSNIENMNNFSASLKERMVRYLLQLNTPYFSDLKQISENLNCSYRQLARVIRFLIDENCIQLQTKGKYKIIDYEKMETLF